ncbi:MAG: FAD-dependent oxidoreductase, partial [Actinobacteria bacterium]|nr:FAD-dependent oxidoreductase [Actinomycetota bacterium]
MIDPEMKLTAPRTVWAESGDPQSLRAQLRANLSVDVAIIGAGFTGLWTAYYLKKIAPNLDISILEANNVGFGASGRNGGWCSTLFPASTSKLTKNFGPIAARKMYDAMVANLAEIDRVCRAEQIDCDWTQGGTLVVARNEVQRTRAQAEVAEHLANGLPESDLIYLSADEVIEKANFTEALGGTFTPNCAAINPLKLVTGLARVLEALGVQIFEDTRVLKFSANEVVAETATVQAKYVVRATEGYTPNLAQNRRTIAPVYSLMIATEPLSEQIWSEIGLSGRQTFSDYRNLVIYGQRTA